jgi:hypothetical protein
MAEDQAHESPFAKPQREHEWLHQLVGEWTSEMEASMVPGEPPVKHKGTESVRSIGGLWVQGEGQGDTPGGSKATMVLTLGYDPQKKRFIGTWFGSMMTLMWIYEGELDAAEKVLTLNTTGPSMAGDGGMAQYQDIIEIVSKDERLLRSQQQQLDGSWQHFMTARYKRVK